MNLKCLRVSIDVSGAYFDFGAASVQLECPWRIMSEGRIALGSVDHEQAFGLPKPVDAAVEASNLLKGHPVERAEVLPHSSDLVIDFGKGLRLEGWNSSSGYEGWSATGPNNQRIVALGGGDAGVWEQR